MWISFLVKVLSTKCPFIMLPIYFDSFRAFFEDSEATDQIDKEHSGKEIDEEDGTQVS